MNLGLHEGDYPTGFLTEVDPHQEIKNWYDLLDDPFGVIKKKCKPIFLPNGGTYVVEEKYYLTSRFTEDKINSPSFADESDTVLNNIVLDSNGNLLQMYFETDNSIEELSSKGMFKIHVTEYKQGKMVTARRFNGYLQ